MARRVPVFRFFVLAREHYAPACPNKAQAKAIALP